MRNCPNCSSNIHSIIITEGVLKIARCRSCGLVYLLNPPEEKEIYEDYYSVEFGKEDYSHESEFGHLREIYAINRQRVNKLKSVSGSGKSLLDIGCGTGLFMKTASESGFETYGIDISNNALRFAREEFGLNAEKKSVKELITEGKSFDIITLWHVLEHFLNPVKELKLIRELLNEKGLLIIEVPNFNSIEFRLSGRKWKGGNHPLYHRTFFTAKTLEDTLKLSGLGNFRRFMMSYRLPGRNFAMNVTKAFFNLLSMDAFLDYTVYKK